MKNKIAFWFLCCILLIGRLNAQSGLHVGAKMFGGSCFVMKQKSCDINKYWDDAMLDSSSLGYRLKFGYFGGASFGYFFRRDMGIVLDILYSKNGQNYYDVHNNEAAYTLKKEMKQVLTFSNLQFPLMFKWIFGEDGFIKGYLAGGPNFSFVMGVNQSVQVLFTENATGKIVRDTTIIVDNADLKYNKFDLGFNAEGGVHFYVKKNFYFNIGLNSCISLMDINSPLLYNCVSRNDQGQYRSSRNARIGFLASVNYVFFNKERRIRWRNGSF